MQAMHEDMQIVIKVRISFGVISRFRYLTMTCRSGTPLLDPLSLTTSLNGIWITPQPYYEEFAEVDTQELGLEGGFKYVSSSVLMTFLMPICDLSLRTAISHSIREQVQTYQKSLFLVKHPSDGIAVQDDNLKQSFLSTLSSGVRPVSDVGMFSPLLNYLNDGDLERTEKKRDKDLNKRRKRNTRGRRGVALPDPRTHQGTPAIGFPRAGCRGACICCRRQRPDVASRGGCGGCGSFVDDCQQLPTWLCRRTVLRSRRSKSSLPRRSLPPQLLLRRTRSPRDCSSHPRTPQWFCTACALCRATWSTASDSSMSSLPADNEAPRSSSSVAPSEHNNRSNKIITAKRMKELEREAKEKEFVDGQHLNYIDGVWHCSNCGYPESIAAVGERAHLVASPNAELVVCNSILHSDADNTFVHRQVLA